MLRDSLLPFVKDLNWPIRRTKDVVVEFDGNELHHIIISGGKEVRCDKDCWSNSWGFNPVYNFFRGCVAQWAPALPHMQMHVVKGLIPETTMWKNTLDTMWYFNATGIHHIGV